MTPCTQEQHDALKADPERMRAECKYVGIMDYGHTLLELFNCRCNSTISLPGIGPEMDLDNV